MLQVNDISHRYDETETLNHVSISLERGETGCILGPSGCGKTTLLRCVAGFEVVTGGQILIDGALCSSVDTHVPPEARRIGMVFQDYALLPHLTVTQNVQFGLHEIPREQSKKKAQAMLSKVGLGHLAARYPHELSGGQQQRVAIARALAPSPELLLMDEPFSNIDAGMKAGLGREMKALLVELGTTSLIATHDHDDAFTLGDKIGILNQGALVQWDSAYDVYHQPGDRFVANFVGRGVWLPGLVLSDTEIEIEIGVARGTMTTSHPAGTNVDLFLRPDDIVHDDDSPTQAEVVNRQFRGSEFLYELRLKGGSTVYSSVPSHHDHHIGELIGIRLETDHMVVFSSSD